MKTASDYKAYIMKQPVKWIIVYTNVLGKRFYWYRNFYRLTCVRVSKFTTKEKAMHILKTKAIYGSIEPVYD